MAVLQPSSRLIACAAFALLVSDCSTPVAAPAPARVELSIPFAGNAWESIGRELAGQYNRRFGNVTADVVMAESLESQVDAMQAAKVDLALEDAETAYLAYTRGTDRVRRRTIGCVL